MPHPDDLVIDDPVSEAGMSTLRDVFAAAAARAGDRRVLVMARVSEEDEAHEDKPWTPIVWPAEGAPREQK